MAYLIFKNSEYVDRTIHEIKQQTPEKYIDKIIIIDGDFAKEFNNIAKTADTNDLVYFNNYGKASELLFEELILFLHNNTTSLISPRIYDLDTDLWSSLPEFNDRINFRSNLSTYNKLLYNKIDVIESPIISNDCFFVDRSHLIELGGFVENIPGYEMIELSIRNWSYGYNCYINHKVSYSTPVQYVNNVNSAATVSAMWLGKYHEYGNISRYDRKFVTNGKIFNDDLFARINLELIGYNRIKNAARGRNVAVIADGPSIDNINFKEIYDNNDIIIGVDLISEIVDCDYVVSFNHNHIESLINKYDHSKILAPHVLYNVIGKTVSETKDISPDITHFELAAKSGQLYNQYPIINSGSPVHSAIHIALIMNPIRINLYGVDFNFVNDKSHTNKISVYNNGHYYPNNETTTKLFDNHNSMLKHLSTLASSLGIPVIRHSHI